MHRFMIVLLVTATSPAFAQTADSAGAVDKVFAGWTSNQTPGCAVGVQVNLPVSLEHSAQFVTHWNAGATLTPSAKNAVGNEATTRSYNAGGSVIWLAQSALNFMLEVVWASDEAVSGPNQRVRDRSLFISPGVRGAFDFPSGLQIVPGIAVPIGIGPSRGDREFFLYLSFEHPFSASGRR